MTLSAEATGTFEAIAEYQAAGGAFAVCTGRDLASARGVLKGLDIDRMPGAATAKKEKRPSMRYNCKHIHIIYIIMHNVR